MDTNRVRFLAYSALQGFETLDPEDALDGAIADLLDILLHVANDPVAVSLAERIERNVRGKIVFSGSDRADLAEV
nr:hypothetical protein [Roseibium aggregatum]